MFEWWLPRVIVAVGLRDLGSHSLHLQHVTAAGIAATRPQPSRNPPRRRRTTELACMTTRRLRFTYHMVEEA